MARTFNGNTDNLKATTVTSLTPPVTMAAWIYPTRTPDGNVEISFHNGTVGTNGMSLNQGDTAVFASGNWYTSIWSIVHIDSGAALTLNTWSHIAHTFPAAGNVLSYTNGSQTNSTANPTFVSPSGGNLFIGGTGTANQSLSGNLADCAGWNVVLTAAEISALAKGARPPQIRPANLVGWWPVSGLQSPELDLSGKANNATVTGAVQGNSDPPVMQFTPRWPQQLAAITSVTVPELQNFNAFMGRRVAVIGY